MSQLNSIKVLTLVATLGLAPAVHASVPADVSRDTGIGLEIAAQGNHALAAIRADVKRSIKAWRPALPAAQVLPVSLPLTAPAGGGGTTTSVASAQRCAK